MQQCCHDLSSKEHFIVLIMHHYFLAVFVAMLEIGKLFFWQAWAKLEASEHIADRFHELIPDMALDFPFELDAFQKEVFTLLIIFLLVTQVP
jgi:hypothetical protein